MLVLQRLLREEVSHLRHKVDHHPEVTRYAMESMELKSEREGWQGGWGGAGRVGGAPPRRNHRSTVGI